MKTKLTSRRRMRGFTLMEMILVLAIIAVLVGMGIYSVRNVGDDANIVKARADVNTLETTIIRFKTRMTSMPSSLKDLAVRPANVRGPWQKMIEETALTDAWGNPYQFRNPGRHNPSGYDLYSMGPDGKDGTDDDIGNWRD